MYLVLSAVCGWLLSITLMVVALVDGGWELAACSLLLGHMSCMPVGALIVRSAIARERQRTEDLVEAVAAQFAAAELPHIGRRSS